MNLVDMLSEHDKKLIDNYIEEYAPSYEDYITGSRAPLNEVLSQWSNAKQRLYKMFGNKFTCVKEIEFETNEKLIYEQLRDVVSHEGSKFICSYWNWYSDYCVNLTYEQKDALTGMIYESIYYPNNPLNIPNGKVCKIPIPGGKTLDLFPNSKVMKILGKLAAIFDLDGFEEFRIAHSRVLNQKSVKGQFVLSIHPLDFMTMSDNECNWESCMSWRNNGGYRAGTVEMMNSDNVVVAYLTASKPMHLFDCKDECCEWSNKKWRCLFIVADQFICKIKSYPYQNDDYEIQMINELAALSKKNLGYEYDNEIIDWDGEELINYKDNLYSMNFEAGYMYNDFGTVVHFFKPHPSFDDGVKHKDFCYSGVSECMWCGKVVALECEDRLLCDSCCEHEYCRHCGDTLSSDYVIYTDFYGNSYCEYCYDNFTFVDDFTGAVYPETEKTTVYLVPSTQLIKKSKYLIQNLANERFQSIFEELGTHTIQVANENFETCFPVVAPLDKICTLDFSRMWFSSKCMCVSLEDCNPEYISQLGLNNDEYYEDFCMAYINYLREKARRMSSKLYLEKCNELKEEFWAEEKTRKSSSSESDED